MSEPVAAPRNAPLELKLRIMLRNWSYPEFREILYEEAREGEDHKYSSVYKRIYAYLRALELRQQGLGYNGVKDIISDEIGYAPSEVVISRWLRGLKSPLRKMSTFDVRQPEVGLILGLILSDGSKYQRHRYNNWVGDRIQKLYNKDEEVLKEFEDACNKLCLSVLRYPHPSEQQAWVLNVSSTLLYLLSKRFDEFVVKAPAELQLTFLRGLWLGDGYIGRAELINTDKRLIEVVSTLLTVHGIKHTVRGPYPPHPPGKRPRYVIYVREQTRRKFLRLTGLADSPLRP